MNGEPSEVGMVVARAIADRRSEIEETIMTRALAVAQPGHLGGDYRSGVREAMKAAFDCALIAIERGAEHIDRIPHAVYLQARSAARNRVGLEIVLRRYASGYAAFFDLLQKYALEHGVGSPDICALQRELTLLFDRLVEAVAAEYKEECDRPGDPFEGRIRSLLQGSLISTASLGYDVESSHVAVVAVGAGIGARLSKLSALLDCRLLTLPLEGGETWAWLGRAWAFTSREVDGIASATWPGDCVLGVGEPTSGVSGWRRTHRQATAALRIALRGSEQRVRYGEAALLAAALADEELLQYLTEHYLDPLLLDGERGGAARRVLRAYFRAECNASSTAAALGMARQTVAKRVRLIEEKLQRPLQTCIAELTLALDLADFQQATPNVLLSTGERQ